MSYLHLSLQKYTRLQCLQRIEAGFEQRKHFCDPDSVIVTRDYQILLLSQARECIVGASLTAHSRSQETDSAPQVFITLATSQHSGAGLPIVIEIREHV